MSPHPKSTPALLLSVWAATQIGSLAAVTPADDDFSSGTLTGGSGWLDDWTTAIHAPGMTITPDASGNALVTSSSTTTGNLVGKVMRQYGAGSTDTATITFDFTVGQFPTAGGSAHQDRFEIHARSNRNGSTSKSDSWIIYGGENLDGLKAGAGNKWIFAKGNQSGGVSDYEVSPVALVAGHTYRFTIVDDAAARTYVATVDDHDDGLNVNAHTTGTLNYRRADGIANPFLHFGNRLSQNGDSAEFTVDNVTIAGPGGGALQANNDSYALPHGDTTISVAAPGVLANDVNAITAVLDTPVSTGSLTLNSDGGFDYDSQGAEGSFTFKYQAVNGPDTSTAATVTLTVSLTGDVIALSPTSVTVDENDVFAEVSVTRSGSNSSAASVYVSTADDTATAGSDFTTTRGTLSWGAGETGARTVRVPILNDGLGESAETFDIGLSNAIGSFTLGNAQAQVQISDDDTGGGTPPSITSFDLRYSARAGETVDLSVLASGAATLSYQWFHENQPLGSDSDTLTLNAIDADDIGDYRVVVSNAFGSVTSPPASLELIWDAAYVFGGGSGSFFQIEKTGDQLEFSYQVTRPDATYLLETCIDLQEGHWAVIDTLVANSQALGPRTVTVAIGDEPRRFFRLHAYKTPDAVSPLTEQPNVLFISMDDLNDFTSPGWLNADVITPNLDRLASRGIFFTNAHCNYAVCGPSRASVLSGLHAYTLGYDNQPADNDVQTRAGNHGTSLLHSYFADSGYRTMAVGKILHTHVPSGSVDASGGRGNFKTPVRGPDGLMGLPKINFSSSVTISDWWAVPTNNAQITVTDHAGNPVTSTNTVDIVEADFPDHQAATWANDQLAQTQNEPFFMMVGFLRPHNPWYVPKQYYDLYDHNSLTLPPYNPNDFDDIPQGGKDMVIHGMPHIDAWEGDSTYAIGADGWRDLVHHYLACITFADAQLGRILDALDASPHKDNTIIVLWSDHGYQMGEKNTFQKHAVWERDTHVPVIMAGPRIPRGIRCNQTVGLIDLYPTLVELANLPINSTNEGRSLVPLINDPTTTWSHPVLSEYSDQFAVRSDRYRYIRYSNGGEELYDHETDPNEWTNLASDSQYDALKATLGAHIP